MVHVMPTRIHCCFQCCLWINPPTAVAFQQWNYEGHGHNIPTIVPCGNLGGHQLKIRIYEDPKIFLVILGFLDCSPMVVHLKDFPNIALICSLLEFFKRIPKPMGATLGVQA